MIAFVQPFGLHSPGGGPRILRALLQNAPLPFISLCTSPQAPPPTTLGREIHLPTRPHLGRIESTRFARLLGYADRALREKFRNRLEATCRAENIVALHGLTHSLDFWGAYQVAQKLQVPYFLSVHDDLAYALQGRPELKEGLAHIAEVWQSAQGRFVISEPMGEEYCRRYGRKPYTLVTDGLQTVPAQPCSRPSGSCRIYFMGLFHLSYQANLRALLQALAQAQARRPEVHFSLVCRCGTLPPGLLGSGFPVTVLPFGSEEDVARDMEAADWLYLPLPFGQDDELFVRFSLSTKMITYLGSGLPILYHGPEATAANSLLAEHGAAVLAQTLDPACIAETLREASGQAHAVVDRALALARSRFLLTDQRARFWGALGAPRAVSLC